MSRILRTGFTRPTVVERFLRGCWALALLTELSRGVPLGSSPLRVVERPRVEGIRALMPIVALGPLEVLLERSQRILVPFIDSRGEDRVWEPAFSELLPGDGDLIAGRTLVEIKAVSGRRSRAGVPRLGLDARTLYQCVVYALLAHAEYQVEEVAIFNPRWSHLHAWPVDSLLTVLAGKPVQAAGLAAELVAFLADPPLRTESMAPFL